MAEEFKRTRIALDSLGCKLNQAELELLSRQLSGAGYHLVAPADEADVYILNTCTVTHVADRKSRHLLRMAHRRHPDACLVVIGCYAERAPEELSRIEGVDIVLGNERKNDLLRVLEESAILQRSGIEGGRYHDERTRAFIKVQDGCDNYCAYCIVPLVRRGEQSVPVGQIITEVKRRVDEGYQEVVLTGTEIGSYRSAGANLKELLENILKETAITRLRLSSLQPQEISPEFIGLWHDERLCSHFHLSLQSGSDGVLRRMKRLYSTADYQQAVSLIRKVVLEAAITTDVIVGFPGETEKEFQQSHDFCCQTEFARIHVFPYSPRRGTVATRMPQQIAAKEKKQRSQQMLSLAAESTIDFNKQYLGKVLPVLWEQHVDGCWSGLTGNYIKVYTKSGDDLSNRILPVKLVETRDDGIWGEIA
ncbi:tRNA (N(6)-L-threonylcarbamoyladenosine(37)-C(2))-methylthiotransferase MtaB [Chloroflexota bacterium]